MSERGTGDGVAETVVPVKDARRHDLDALRGFAMLLGIVLHAALSFMPGMPWIVQDEEPFRGVGETVSAIHGFRMPLFFLLSGFFTAMLWRRRGMGGLLKQRTLRILVPLAIGAGTLVPVMWWLVIAFGSNNPAPVEVAPETTIYSAARDDNGEAIRVLVEDGAEVNTPDPQFQTTPLGWAAIGDSPEAASVLIELGADPNQTYGMGSTPSHTAMFFGHAAVAEALIDGGADLTIRDPQGSTPEATMNAPQQLTMMIAGFVQLESDWEAIASGRDEIRAMLAARGLEGNEPPPTLRESLSAVYAGLTEIPFFHHLWFLWHLCFLVVLFAVVVLVGGRVGTGWVPGVLIATPLALVWLVPLTAWTQSLMTMSPFGPDTSAGLIPMPRVLGHYAVFFLFGALVYTRPGAAERLGRGWWLMLPLAVAVLVPTLAMSEGASWTREWGLSEEMFRLVGLAGQSLFCWLMVFGLMGLFESWLSRERGWVRFLSDSSYWLYLIHLPLVIVGQWAIRDWDVPGPLKLALLLVVTMAVLLVSYRYLVRYTPIGRLLNGRRERPGRAVVKDPVVAGV